MSRSTLSSMDSVGSPELFQSIYSTLNRLKEETTAVRDGLKACNKRIVEVPLGDRLLDPKPHALPWFKARKLETPCDLEVFLETFFGELGAKKRICSKTRTLLLNPEEATLFQLEPNYVYRWIEILERLPVIFY
jgi:hypothetical protein